jgi:hypothetical protein
MLKYIILYILKVFRRKTIINKILKTSIMGNEYDKTLSYYMSSFEPSYLDTNIQVWYKKGTKQYICPCETNNFEECIKYVNFTGYIKENNTVEFAYIYEGAFIKNITERVLNFAGPFEDFNKGSEFHVRKKNISDYNVYIIDSLGKIHVFSDDDEFINLISK